MNLYKTHTDTEIGQTFKVSASTVRRWRRKYGILSRPKGKRSPRSSRMSDRQIQVAVNSCYSIAGVLRTLGFSEGGGNFVTMKKRIRSLRLDTSHFGTKKVPVLGYRGYKVPLEEYLVKGRITHNTQNLKRRLVSEGCLEEKCALCGLGPLWNGGPLVLQLDHINGDKSDNRLRNLRILCPNCHSQTKTYTGRNIGKSAPKQQKNQSELKGHWCLDCGKRISKRATRCKSCASKQQPTKTCWPPHLNLLQEISQTSFSAVATRLGVSDKAVQKRLRMHSGNW